jgi:hypothetical protein
VIRIAAESRNRMMTTTAAIAMSAASMGLRFLGGSYPMP